MTAYVSSARRPVSSVTTRGRGSNLVSRSSRTMSSTPKEETRTSRSRPTRSRASARTPDASRASASGGSPNGLAVAAINVRPMFSGMVQPPASADGSFESAEEQAVDDRADEEDHEHHSENARSIREVSGKLEPDADGRFAGNDHQQLAGHEAAPGECPALFEACRKAGQIGAGRRWTVRRQRSPAARRP